jgi:GNAT superfamily N-acetyltransferase
MLDAMHLYRAGRRLVRSLPAWLLRFRPFVVYEIPLARGGDAPIASWQDAREPLADGIAWIADAAQAAYLGPLASQECIDSWNAATRRAAAVWEDGQPIACAWIASESFDEGELGVQFVLRPDEVWLYAAVVAPGRRAQGVYGRLLEFVIADLRAAGLRRMLLGVTVGNEPSRRAHVRQGAVEAGRLIALRALGVTICRTSGGLSRVPQAERGARGPVRLRVDA